jgi:hypothetical protein
MTFDLRESAPRVCFGLACLVGLVGAFVGLNASGFWLDELFTHWVIDLGGGARQVTDRVLTDMHPPVYYAIMALWARMFGDSEAPLRSFSALCGVGAVLVFVLGSGRAFSLNARLFAAAMATGSGFWFYQTQNARDYGLCLLIGAGLLALALRLLEESAAPRTRALWGLLGLMAVSPFIHFYLMYESLAVLMVLAVFRPDLRWRLGVAFVALLAVSEAYVHFVIARHAQYSLTSSWIQNGLGWYRNQLTDARRDTVNSLGFLSLALCVLAAILAGLGRRKDGEALLPLGPILVLCLGVPVIILGGGVLSSIIVSPNFTARNLLIASPFFWSFYAWLYAAGPDRLRGWMKVAATAILSVLALGMATLVLSRGQTHNESFRESAAWIKTFPACRGVVIPVLSVERSAWVRPGFDDVIVKTAYGHYLAGYAPLRVIGLDWTSPAEVPDDLRAEVQRRIDGVGCPIIGWASQGYDPRDKEALPRRWLALFDRAGATRGLAVKTFEIYSYGLGRAPAATSPTVVLFMNRDQRP